MSKVLSVLGHIILTKDHYRLMNPLLCRVSHIIYTVSWMDCALVRARSLWAHSAKGLRRLWNFQIWKPAFQHGNPRAFHTEWEIVQPLTVADIEAICPWIPLFTEQTSRWQACSITLITKRSNYPLRACHAERPRYEKQEVVELKFPVWGVDLLLLPSALLTVLIGLTRKSNEADPKIAVSDFARSLLVGEERDVHQTW